MSLGLILGRRLVVCATVGLVILGARAEGGRATIADIRVAPMVDSHWNQTKDSGFSNVGDPCFNSLTPNNYRAGCSALPMAQVIRYWRYPARIAAQSFVCQVDGVNTTINVAGEDYLWDEMPGVTTNGTTAAQRKAIGQLVRDCALSLHSSFAKGDTVAFGSLTFVPLKEVFGYRNAIGYGCRGGSSFDISVVQDAIFASLDAGAPVIVSLCQNDPDGLGHMVLADGYGFEDGTAYVHLNLGYSDVKPAMADAWYALPNVTINSHVYDKVDGVIYNIFPVDSGDVLSGRVLWTDGTPVAGVSVTAKLAGATVATVTTDAMGIYAFVLPGGKSYTVSAGNARRSVALKASVSSVVDWSRPFSPYYVKSQFGTPGNSWGNDLTITSTEPDPEDPEPEEPETALGSFMPSKAATLLGAVYDETSVPCGTITLKVGKPSKKGVSSVSGSIALLDGKKYTIKSVKVLVNELGPCEFDTTVAKLGTANVQIGENGFAVRLKRSQGGDLTAAPADLTTGFSTPEVSFSVTGLPETVNGQPVLAACTPEGEKITVSSKGKWTLGKAASPKLKKVALKDENGKKYYQYELQGLDDPKKPNKSALKLTYTAKTGTFKGSFALYCNTGTKLAKYTYTVNGLVIDGVGVGTAICKKPAQTLMVTIK